jgi:hypothetical protein
MWVKDQIAPWKNRLQDETTQDMKRLLKHIFKKNTFTHHFPMALGPILQFDRVIAPCLAPTKNPNPGHLSSSLLVRGISSCFVASRLVAPPLVASPYLFTSLRFSSRRPASSRPVTSLLFSSRRLVARLHVAPLLLSSHVSLADRLKKWVATPTIIPENRARSWADLREGN